MTKQEGINKLIQLCNDEVKNSGFWFFNKKRLLFDRTKYLEPYEKEANLPVPETLLVGNLSIDPAGIKIWRTLYKWPDICATAVKTEVISVNDEKVRYDRSLLICLNTGEIMDIALGDIEYLRGLLGHFIESYKIAHDKINATS